MSDPYSQLEDQLNEVLEENRDLKRFINKKWLPIDIAPRDGTEVLLAEWVCNFYDPAEDEIYGRWYQFVGAYDQRQDVWLCTEYEAFGHRPKYWIPLPQPPRGQDE